MQGWFKLVVRVQLGGVVPRRGGGLLCVRWRKDGKDEALQMSLQVPVKVNSVCREQRGMEV